MLKSAKKILVISAHADDMELGCGGTVHKLLKAGKEVYSLILSFNMKGLAAKFKFQDIEKEVYQSASILGLKKENVLLENFENRIFPQFRQEILDKLWEY